MRIISTCLVLLISGFAFSQFNRTFMHGTATSGNAAFSSFSYFDSQNKINLASLSAVGSGQIKISTQRISDLGDVEAFNQQSYAVTLPGTIQSVILLTAIEQGNELYYALEVGASSSMKLIWLKVNKTTGALISSVTSPGDYRLSYFEPKLIGNELVTYVIRNTGGFVRVAVNTATFNPSADEVVDAAISTAFSPTNTLNAGYKSGSLFVVNGLEKVVCSTGVPAAVLYTRTAANTYTSVTSGITTTRSVSSFLVDPTTIGITNGANIEHYNVAGAMTNNGVFVSPSGANASQVEFVNNKYHLFYKYNTGYKGIFFTADQSFQFLDSVSTTNIIYHIAKRGTNGVVLTGSNDAKGLSLDLENNPSQGRAAYCEFYKNRPVLKRDEYGTSIQAGYNLKASVGLGTKVITSPDNFPGATYNGVSSCYNLSESFVGFIGNDTIANAESGFNEQYHELPGPYTTSAMYDQVQEAKYNRPYHVSLQMIEDHIDSLQSGSSSYVPVWQIRNWPAHGNTALGQEADLAPFVDVNGNGTYEPLQGDYPSIYGNDCVFSITHYRTNGNAAKAVEFHSYVYTEVCDTSETFENVLMRKIQVYSRGAEIDSMFFGGRFDGDLGNYNDDYFGTKVDLGLVYNYNADLMDEDNSGRRGFHDTIPAQGIMVLKGFKQANDGLDNGIGLMPGESVNGYGYNDGVTDNEYEGLYASSIYTGTNAAPAVSDPATTGDLHNILNGYFRFGDPMYYGGTGFPGSPGVTNIRTNYLYSGYQDPNHFGTEGINPGFDNWSEYEPAGPGSISNPGGDRRGGYSFGKTALGNGESFELDYAYLIKSEGVQTTAIFNPVNALFAKATAVRNAFLSNEGPCGIDFGTVPEDLGVEESAINGDLYAVYPNPTAGSVRINGISDAGATIQVFDINGKLLQTVSDYQNMQEIDLGGLDGNLFIIRITDGSKYTQKRVVKH